MAILLSRGAKNIPAEVQRWQYFLKRNRIDQVGQIDADFGLKTETATKIFQLQIGLKASGKLDAATHDVATTLNYRNLDTAYYDDHDSLSWPPKPAFGSPGNSARNKHLQCFSFILQNEANRPDRETIVIKGSCDGTVKDWVGTNIVEFSVPQLEYAVGYGGRVRCHRLIKSHVEALFQRWEADDLLHLLLTYAGAFVPRYVRDTKLPVSGHGPKESSSVGSLSNHAFGSAFDINVAWNPRVKEPPPPKVSQKGSVRFLVPAANELGFFWGGHYEPPTKYDGMHFEFADFDRL